MIEIRQFVDRSGRQPYQRWFDDLDHRAAARVGVLLSRLLDGNTSSLKSVGEGVHELKIDYGPGYRVYFGWQGATIIVLLGGGTKKRQQQDIAQAKARWAEFRRRVR
jgi:putative addiction module killer protein